MPDTLDETLEAADVVSDPINTMTINSDLRTVTIPVNFVLGVFNDKDTHRVHFTVPRYYGEFDLSEFRIRINYINAQDQGDQYQVQDAKVDGDTLTFSWLVSSRAYVSDGLVRFSVCFIKTDKESGVVEEEFNTTVHQVSVLQGLEIPDPMTEEERSDLLTLIETMRDHAKESEEAAKTSETNAKASEEAAKTSETNSLASEKAAKASENASATSEQNAKTSETNAKASEKAALASQNAAKTSETNAKVSEEAAATSEENALASEKAAKTSETNAKTSETNSSKSEQNAKTSETNAASSEKAAKTSETNASNSAAAAKTSETNASDSATDSSNSASAAKTSETNASASEKAAKTSETNAKTSETNAKTSENKAASSASAAKTSETNAASSEKAAKTSETNAATSENNASDSASNASTSEGNAASSEKAAKSSETNAAKSASDASASAKSASNSASASANSASAAKTSETNAAKSAGNAKTSETNSKDSENLARSYAIGGTGTRSGEDSDNASYYANLAAQRVASALRPEGTITFEELPTVGVDVGFMYNISNDFVTTSAFKEGAGVAYAAGTNIYYVGDGEWDVLGGATVIGVKGANESKYRNGNVSLTPDNIGAVPTSRTVNGHALSNNVSLNAKDVGVEGSYLPLTGGSLTGNLTGKKITGTTLVTTDATRSETTQDKICVIDADGSISYRTISDIKSDIDLASGSANGLMSSRDKTYLDSLSANLTEDSIAEAIDSAYDEVFTQEPEAEQPEEETT